LPPAERAAVVADHGRRHPVRFDQLKRLRVIACGDLDLVPIGAEQLDERTEDERMR